MVGVYPYDEIQKPEDLKKRSLPPRCDFGSCLGMGSKISEEDYEHAKKVWKEFEIKDTSEYSKLYCRLDTVKK